MAASVFAVGLQLAPTTVSTNADLLVFFVVGLLAGAHCLGMCGPLVSVYADRITSATSTRRDDTLTPFQVRQHALFNLGRTAGYATVGAVLGFVGGTLFVAVDGVTTLGTGVRAGTGAVVGVFIILGGLSYLLRGRATAHVDSIPLLSSAFQRVSGVLLGRVDRLATSGGIVGLGAVHAVLPCPIIYPTYLYAFAIGDPVRGGLSLAVLGLGTVPTLFAYGTMLGSLSTAQRAGLHRALGVGFVLLGYVPLSHGLMLMGFDVPHLDLPYYQPLT